MPHSTTIDSIELRNVGTNRQMSHETLCFWASVYVNGVRAFSAENAGRGGCNEYHAYGPRDAERNRRLLRAAEQYAATLPPIELGPDSLTGSLKMDLDLLIGGLLQFREEQGELRRLTKKNTVIVYREPGMPEDQCVVTNGQVTPEIRTRILTEFPGAEILNDRLLDGPLVHRRSASV